MLTVLIILGALLLGSSATWLFMRKSKEDIPILHSPKEEQGSIPTVDVKSLETKLEESQSLIAEYEKRIETINQKLNARESELSNLQKEFANLVNVSQEEQSTILIEKYKQEIAKKSKEIKDNEEEIEELEDELSAVKKKLTKVKSENEESKTLLEKCKRQLKDTETELIDTKAERDELKKENELKAETIEFVNAVLTASEADDKDAQLIDSKVKQIESIISDQYIPLLNHENFYTKWSEKDSWIEKVRSSVDYWGNLQRKSWLNEKKVIAFIGEFSAGKTSIVNRILSQDDPGCPTLPVSSKATTAIATYISYGAGFLSQFTDASEELKNLSRDMFLKVNKEVFSRINASSLIRHFVMKYHNENLKGLSILDTPGFSSNDAEDQGRTLDVIREADALFWVMDANTGDINKSSLKVISDNIQDLPMYIIINKSDTKSPGELDRLEQHIRSTMSKAGINVMGYVRFSQESKLDDLMHIIQSIKRKEVSKDIKDIYIEIQHDINQLSSNLKELKTDIRETENRIETLEDSISTNLTDLSESSKTVASIPRYNSRWFHADDYRMDQDEFENLTHYCEIIANDSDCVEEEVAELKEAVKKLSELSDNHNQTKELANSLKSILAQLMNAIKDFNPDLYKELTYAMKNIGQDMDNNSYEVSQENEAFDNSFEGEEPNISSSESNGYEEFQKAQSFSDLTCSEAKFWFIRSAKLGYEEAIRYCKYKGIKY